MSAKNIGMCREIYIQGEGALSLVQLAISFLISCFEKNNVWFLLFQQLSLKLIDNCTSSGCCIFQPAFWCKLKNPFFAKFCTKFVTFFAFFQLFSMKNVEIYSRWCTFPLYSPVGHIA